MSDTLLLIISTLKPSERMALLFGLKNYFFVISVDVN